MTGGKERGCLEIMNELLAITREMAGTEDVDILFASIDRRGLLIEEYEQVKAASPNAEEKNRQEIGRVKAEIAKLNKEVDKTLQKLYAQAKDDLKNSNAQNKVLGYTNQAMSSAGSYMDFKK